MRLRTAVYLLAGIILPVLFYRSASTFSPYSSFARRPTARAMRTPADVAPQDREQQQARQPNRRQPPPPHPPPPPLPPQQQQRPGAAERRQMAPPVGVNASAAPRAWSRRPNLIVNGPAQALLDRLDPSRTTLHFTFGSIVMLDFVHNWRTRARLPRAATRAARLPRAAATPRHARRPSRRPLRRARRPLARPRRCGRPLSPERVRGLGRRRGGYRARARRVELRAPHALGGGGEEGLRPQV